MTTQFQNTTVIEVPIRIKGHASDMSLMTLKPMGVRVLELIVLDNPERAQCQCTKQAWQWTASGARARDTSKCVPCRHLGASCTKWPTNAPEQTQKRFAKIDFVSLTSITNCWQINDKFLKDQVRFILCFEYPHWKRAAVLAFDVSKKVCMHGATFCTKKNFYLNPCFSYLLLNMNSYLTVFVDLCVSRWTRCYLVEPKLSRDDLRVSDSSVSLKFGA